MVKARAATNNDGRGERSFDHHDHDQWLSGVGYVWGEGGKEAGAWAKMLGLDCAWEFYKGGKICAKKHFFPQKWHWESPQNLTVQKQGGVGVCLSVVVWCHTPTTPPGTPIPPPPGGKKGFVIWHQFDFPNSIFDYWYSYVSRNYSIRLYIYEFI